MVFSLLPLSQRLYNTLNVRRSIEVSRLLFKLTILRDLLLDKIILFNMFDARFS